MSFLKYVLVIIIRLPGVCFQCFQNDFVWSVCGSHTSARKTTSVLYLFLKKEILYKIIRVSTIRFTSGITSFNLANLTQPLRASCKLY